MRARCLPAASPCCRRRARSSRRTAAPPTPPAPRCWSTFGTGSDVIFEATRPVLLHSMDSSRSGSSRAAELKMAAGRRRRTAAAAPPPLPQCRCHPAAPPLSPRPRSRTEAWHRNKCCAQPPCKGYGQQRVGCRGAQVEGQLNWRQDEAAQRGGPSTPLAAHTHAPCPAQLTLVAAAGSTRPPPPLLPSPRAPPRAPRPGAPG